MKTSYYFITIKKVSLGAPNVEYYEELLKDLLLLGLYRTQVECYEGGMGTVLHYHGIFTSNKKFIRIPQNKGISYNLQKLKTMQDILRVSEYICKNKVDKCMID